MKIKNKLFIVGAVITNSLLIGGMIFSNNVDVMTCCLLVFIVKLIPDSFITMECVERED